MCAKMPRLNQVLLGRVTPAMVSVYQATSCTPAAFACITGVPARSPIHGRHHMIAPAAMKQTARTFSALKKRSTHRPRKNGAMIAPSGLAV